MSGLASVRVVHRDAALGRAVRVGIGTAADASVFAQHTFLVAAAPRLLARIILILIAADKSNIFYTHGWVHATYAAFQGGLRIAAFDAVSVIDRITAYTTRRPARS